MPLKWKARQLPAGFFLSVSILAIYAKYPANLTEVFAL
jgi:hypothetical protein